MITNFSTNYRDRQIVPGSKCGVSFVVQFYIFIKTDKIRFVIIQVNKCCISLHMLVLFFTSQNPSTNVEGDTMSNVDTRCSMVDVADDYTKRKNVLRIANTSAEVLLQTEDPVTMALWLRALQKHAAAEKPSVNVLTIHFFVFNFLH